MFQVIQRRFKDIGVVFRMIERVLDNTLELSKLFVELIVIFNDLFQLNVLIGQLTVDFAFPVLFKLRKMKKLKVL